MVDAAENGLRFDGEVAIVTGAGAGLGRAYALLLASRGAKVVVNDFGQRPGPDGAMASSAELVAKEIADLGGTAVANRASVATKEGGEELAQAALDAFGRIDILVNNAGNIALTSFLKLDLESIDQILDVHLRGAFYVTQPCYQQMVKQQYGRIVMTTSGVGLLGNGGVAAYGAAKGGVFGLLQVLKLEAARHGIKVNAVAPMASTKLTVDVGMPQYLELAEPEVAPELVAPVVAYFAGRDCPFTGEVWSAGSGSVARLFIGRTQGFFRHPTLDGPLTVEDVVANVETIRDEAGYSTPPDWPAEWAEVVALVKGAAASGEIVMAALAATPVGDLDFDAAGRLLLTDLLQARVDETPDAVALRCPLGTWTFAQWLHRATIVGSALGEVARLEPDACVLVWVDTADSREVAGALHGVLHAGGIAAPLDDRLSAPELLRFAADTDAQAAVVSRGLLLREGLEVEGSLSGAGEGDLLVVPISSGVLQPGRALLLPPAGEGTASRETAARRAPEDCAFLAFTSGSTGRPKAAMITHGGSVQLAERMANAVFAAPRGGRRLRPHDVIQSPIPAHLGTSVANNLYPAAFAGCTLGYRGRRFDAAASEREMVEHKTTIYNGAAAHFAMMCQLPESELTGRVAVEVMIASGSPMTRALYEAMRRRWPAVSVANWYALNETMVGQTLNCGAGMEADPTAVGAVVWPTELKIVDDAGAELPAGEDGEILLRSPGQMTGYYRRPEETAERIVDGWIRTGDLGRIDAGDGMLRITGRSGDRINRGAFKFYPAEVEEVLAAHPAVADAGVVGVPHPVLGQDVAAFVVLRQPDANADPVAELQAYCRQRLSRHKVPAHFCVVDSLPRNNFGKLVRRELLSRWEERAAGADQQERE